MNPSARRHVPAPAPAPRSGVLRLSAARTSAWFAAFAFGALGGLGALGGQAALASEARELSSQEEAELRAGKLVVRPELRSVRGVHLRGGMAWQLIRAAPDAVYRTLSDERTYVKYLPSAELVQLASAQPPQLVFVRHRLGFVHGSYYVHTMRDPASRSVRFRMDRTRPSSIRDAWGELRVSPYGKGQCIVSLAIMADLGEGLLIGLVRDNVHTWMLRVPALLKRYVESQPKSASAPYLGTGEQP